MFASRDKLNSVMYLRVTSEEKAFIERQANSKGTTPSAIVRRALELYCKNTNTRKRKARSSKSH